MADIKTAEPDLNLVPTVIPLAVNSQIVAQSLVNQAKLALGQDYHVVDAGKYIAILHSHYGAAAVVSSDNPADAHAAAAELNGLLKKASIATKALPFAVSATTVRPPVIIRSGPQMATDIAVTMGRSATAESEIDEKQMLTILPLLKMSKKKAPAIDPQVLRIIEASIVRITAGKAIYAGGSQIEPEEVAQPDFLLPAVLLSALQTWSIPVVAAKGKGGFTLHLSSDSSAVLMYKVTGIEVASPLFLFLPIINVIRRQQRAGEFVLDDCIERFGNFMTTNDLTPAFLHDNSAAFSQDMSVRIALPQDETE